MNAVSLDNSSRSDSVGSLIYQISGITEPNSPSLQQPGLDIIYSQLRQNVTNYFLKIHLNVILSSTHGLFHKISLLKV
jgi:hypothetical protein